MITPRLETERLILRPLKITDAQVAYDNWTSDPDVSKYMRWNTNKSVEETKTWLTGASASIHSDKAYDWGIELKEIDELIGSSAMYVRNDEGVFELGYCIMKKYWGMGLATEVAQAMVNFAINELGQKKLFAVHEKKNPASGKVLEKVGFIYQSDGTDKSFDGTRTLINREYILTVE